MPLEAARIDLLDAHCQYLAGRKAMAQRMLRAARAQFEALGATAYKALAERGAAHWGVALDGGLDPLGPLTQREKEVARLTCQEMTYQAIADQLHIGMKTVDTHHQNIYKKLNITNRTELKRLLDL
jgi:DNA-binding NarL/FixJ family response regulator